MNFRSLDLWAEEERRIIDSLADALNLLIASGDVAASDGELEISAKLRRHLLTAKKQRRVNWTLHPEASAFIEDYPVPAGHPDFRFSQVTPDYEDYHYDIECKVLRREITGRKETYCSKYVTKGIKRYADGIYAQSVPPMGTMIGYVLERGLRAILTSVNTATTLEGFTELQVQRNSRNRRVVRLQQQIHRSGDTLNLVHLWVYI